MKKLFFTFCALFLACIPVGVFAALGDPGEPAESCHAILAANPSSTDGVYHLQTSSMSSSRQMYCNMTNGGWMLLFQRRGGSQNTESCGTDLNNFLQNNCGSPSSLAYGDSYSSDVDLTLSQFGYTEYLNIQYDNTMTADTDDAFSIESTTNIFPNSTGVVENIPVNAVCDINGGNCDRTDVYWKYVGDSFFGSAYCSSGYAPRSSYDPPLEGDFGYCHNGLATYSANSLFGNRSSYNEVKLWQYAAGSAYMERVFIRTGNASPEDLSLSSESIPTGSAIGSLVGTLSATDLEGDTLTYAFASGAGSDDNSSFSLSGADLLINISPDANVKHNYFIELQVSDPYNPPVEKTFVIYISGGSFLGSNLNPASSCMAIKNAIPSATTGTYYLKSSSMSSMRLMHCEMEINGGGWMLLFQRRGGNKNTESCGTDLNDFLQNDCGSVESLSYGDSYSSDVNLTFSQFAPQEYMNVQYNTSMISDADDAYVIRSSANIFPNNTGSVNNILVDAVCDVNGTNCDTTDVYWKYVGDSFFSSARCSSGYASRTSYSPPLEGMYGYCQNGLASYYVNNLFGDRYAYNEAKLWQWHMGVSYMGRFYSREEIVDTVSPSITSFSPGNNAFTPSKSPVISYTYFDATSGINTNTSTLSLQRWNGTSWGADISTSVIQNAFVAGTGASFETAFPGHGRYRITYSISDYSGNTQSQVHTITIDDPSFEVSSPEADIGILNTTNEQYSSAIQITVQTVGAAFRVYLKRKNDPNYAGAIIPVISAGKGYGYHIAPYSASLTPFSNTPVEIFSQSASLHPNGDKNTYSYNFRLGAEINHEQIAGDYEGNFDVEVVYDY